MRQHEARHEAQHRNDRLAPSARHRWFVRETEPGTWALVKVAGLPSSVLGPLLATTEAKPKPPQADDPRTFFDRAVPGLWVG